MHQQRQHHREPPGPSFTRDNPVVASTPINQLRQGVFMCSLRSAVRSVVCSMQTQEGLNDMLGGSKARQVHSLFSPLLKHVPFGISAPLPPGHRSLNATICTSTSRELLSATMQNDTIDPGCLPLRAAGQSGSFGVPLVTSRDKCNCQPLWRSHIIKAQSVCRSWVCVLLRLHQPLENPG